jgi:V/A-type H+-transporting ATPase subunit A
MMQTILHLHDKCKALISLSMPVRILKENPIFERIIAIKYDIPNDRLDLFEEYHKAIDTFYEDIMKKNG